MNATENSKKKQIRKGNKGKRKEKVKEKKKSKPGN